MNRSKKTSLAIANSGGHAARVRPDDNGLLIVLVGLSANDGSGELAYCKKSGEPASNSFLLDLGKAWSPDGDADLAAVCPVCQADHWTIALIPAVLEGLVDFEEDFITMAVENLLAEEVAQLRARASGRKAARG